MADSGKVSLVLLNWNGRHWLEKFLPSVIQHALDARIVVADNGSTDDSVEWMKINHPDIELIVNEGNLGYAGGYDRVLKKINTEFAVLMNTDIQPLLGWLEPMLELIENNADVAAVQPKMLSFVNEGFFDYAGAAGGFIDLHGFPFCRGRILDKIEIDKGQYDDKCEVFWATGACLLVRLSDYHSVGGFDSDYFAHMEEIDLCWRFWRAGKKVMYCGKSAVLHVNGGTLRTGSPKKHYLNFRNSLFTLFKNLPQRLLFKRIFVRLCIDGLASLKMASKGDVIMLWVILRAHLSFYAKLPLLIKKRKAYRLDFECDSFDKIILPKNIIWQRYFKKKHTFLEIDKIWER
ncbi:MAG: glycosyltransferase family 2 protein [Cytophagales bacterium]